MKNKKGNVTVIAIIIVIVAATAGFIGWSLAKKTQAPVQQQIAITQPTSVEKQPAQPVATQCMSEVNYIEVKEFGIKIPINSAMVGDLAYKYTKAGKDISVDMVNFSSKALTAVDKNCGTGFAGPSIQKIAGTPAKQGGNSDFYTSRMSDIKQFNGYFLVFMNSQDSCTMGKHVDLEKKLDQAISAGFKNSISLSQ
jgi:flagellar basal body-associated protein FliL